MYARIAESAKKFDILGLEINFQMNGLRTYNTYPGLFFTMLLTSFLLYSFIQMVNDIQNGVNPITQKTSQYLQQNEGFNFPAQTFVFVVYIGDSNGIYIQNTPQKTYYTIQFRKRVFGFTGSNITQLGFGQCSQSQLELYEIYGANLPRQFLQCPSDDVFLKDNVMNIQNSLHLQNFTRFQFQVYRCVNSTTANYTCASNEEIDAKLQNAVLSYSFPFYEFNSLNFTKPYEIKVGTKQMTINTQNTKVTNIVYKQSQTFTEQNTFYFFPDQRKDLGIEYYETFLDLQSGTSNGYLGGVQFQLDDQKFIYQRTYQNILNIFGALGGTFSVLRTILLILLKPLQKLSFATIMFNKISNKRQIRISDYFKSNKQRQVIQEYYDIIQKAIELESYMEIMLKYENDLLTFRSDKLVTLNAELFKSQRLQNLTEKNDIQIANRLEEAEVPLDLNIQQLQFEQVQSAREMSQRVIRDKRVSYNSDDYIQFILLN
ncbi:hypothetical protein pb186bvf_010875 [Paramecium bursaria]